VRRRCAGNVFRVLGCVAAIAGGMARADTDTIFADSFGAVCGNNVVEVPETCDGNCSTCVEAFVGFTSTGSPATCDVVCHIPIQTCQAGDNVCPFVAGLGGAHCNAQSDAECLGTAWKSLFVTSVNTTSLACVPVNIYGIQPGGSYDITTCAPTPALAGSGDPRIDAVTDNFGTSYLQYNDDCTEPWSVPLLAGWTCNNSQGEARMSCVSPSPTGFRVSTVGVNRLTVTVCPFGSAGGIAPLYIWYNATTIPNPG